MRCREEGREHQDYRFLGKEMAPSKRIEKAKGVRKNGWTVEFELGTED